MKSADELLDELAKTKSLSGYFKKNEKLFTQNDISLSEFWNNACEKSNMSKSHIISHSGFSYCYFYDVINGRKTPNKDKIIRLALTMKLTLDECQQALILSGKSPLYPTMKRDSIMIFCILHGLSIHQCSDLLEAYNESTLK